MKSTLLITSALWALGSSAFSADESTGKLSVDKNIVRQGFSPTLKWNISHPRSIEDIVKIEDDVIKAKTKLRVEVFVIGVGITNGTTEAKAESNLHFSTVGKMKIFEGKGSEVDASKIHINRIIRKGETISFSARYYWNGWKDYFDSAGDNVKALVNGDTPPSKAGAYDQSSLDDYLQPYVKNGKLKIGKLDVIYAAELTHTDTSKAGYDMQDTVVLLRFIEVE